MRAQPVPWLTICCRRPLRSAKSCVTTPTYSSGTSIATRSTGSQSLPSIFLVSTSGLPTVSSKPSRRMISTSTASCSSPRPCTSQVSGRSVGSTRSETLPTSSWSRRCLTRLAVSLSPSVPASGRGVDADRDAEARLVDDGDGQRARVVRVGDRLADRHVGQAGQRDDVAGACLVGRDAVERLGDVELGRAGGLDRAVGAAPGDLLALAQVPVHDPQQREAADVRVGVEVRDERLQRMVRVVRRRRDGGEERVEERAEVRLRACRASARLSPRARSRRRSGTRSASRSRRGRGTARRPRRRPPGSGRRAGRSCSRRARRAGSARAPCAARSGSAAAGLPRRRRAAGCRRPSSARARPRRRSRRGPACR